MDEITLIGYGNQGKAWAHNLRDSGWTVTVSGRASSEGGKGLKNAQNDGFSTISLEEIAKKSNKFFESPIALLLPDEKIPVLFQKYFVETKPHPRTFVFAHGYSVAYGGLAFQANDNIILVAPKGIGVKLRERYEAGSGVMGVLGVAQDSTGRAWDMARKIATGLGCARVGLLESSFLEETQADLFSEQIILCGLLPKLIKASVDFLVKKGIDPKLATYECLHESNLIIEMMQKRGIEGMFQDVSTTARFGGLQAVEKIISEDLLQERFKVIWENIVSEKFSKDLKREVEQGFPFLNEAIKYYQHSVTDKNL